MKKNILRAAAILLTTAIPFSGCKKSSTTPDNSPAFKNTVWTGDFNYTGKAVEPVSIAFADNGTLTWHELTGDYTGVWKLTGTQVTISLGSSVSFTAEVSGGNKLTNIQNSDPAGRSLDDAALNTDPDNSLDNTTWTAPNLVLKFKTGNVVDMILGANTIPQYPNVSYTRVGKSLRFNASASYKWFMIYNSSSSMKGANSFTGDPTVYPFVAARQ